MTFDDLMHQFGPALKRLVASYQPPGAGREDLEQEIALAIYQAIDAFRGECSWRTYVYRIAHNCAARAAHRASKHDTEQGWDLAQAPAPAHRSPEALTLEKERYEQLTGALRRLPLKWRQPLTMRLDGLSYKEIAVVLELEPATVGTRIHRATQALKDLMEATR